MIVASAAAAEDQVLIYMCIHLFTRSTSFDSVAKTLLQVDILQKDLIDYLLERLPEFYDELENEYVTTMMHVTRPSQTHGFTHIYLYSQSSTCTARLILHQLRWSEYIVDPQALSGKLIEVNTWTSLPFVILTIFSLVKIIHITPPVIQHEIITSLPDIINDTEHKVMLHLLAISRILTKDR